MIIDLTGIREGTGPARLLDMVEGRSKQAFKTWLAERPEAWRDAVEVVAMDGFTGFKTATAEELPDAVAVMDPFHVVRLAGDAHVEVEATWGIYQRMIAAYRAKDRRRGRELMTNLIESIRHGVPKALNEVITLKKRAVDVLAYFDRPYTLDREEPLWCHTGARSGACSWRPLGEDENFHSR